jgi:hypothetical protein
MASTIKVNNIQNQCGANIANKCGTTITLGASGDTITLACGASQTGFGRTGTVDWDTTAKTASFTAVSGNGYFVNTTSGAVTVTLPASPSVGDIVAIKDYASTADTNNITIGRNGSNIDGDASDLIIDKANSGITLVYVDGTQGWKGTQSFNISDIEIQPEFIVACGGTITECGNFKIHTFTGPGTFTVTCVGNPAGSDSVDYLVVAGGGGGGSPGNLGYETGGGGAGGYRESSGAASGCYTASPLGACVAALPVTAQGYPVVVGGGGTTSPGNTVKYPGNNSSFSTVTSTAGGGGGGGGPPGAAVNGDDGGSGGGGTFNSPSTNGGNGNTPPVSPPQGNPGGTGGPFSGNRGGGGGGAGSAGVPHNGPAIRGAGGLGVTSSISSSSVGRAGGGDAGAAAGSQAGPFGGGGGTGSTNTGSGGAGIAAAPPGQGSNGGSGIVIIRYKFQ